ncbi:hypothetical protein ACHAPJ_005138 [Fusarium lateritium]
MELQQPPKSDRVAFQYTSLNITRREIRLLTLSPREPGTPIVGHVHIVSLDDKPEYEALSYMWGPPEPSYDITINDSSTLSIGYNLRKALDDLRLPDKPRVIWNDAICMNQNDNEEKGHHIQLMRTIYASASTVCAWIDHEVDPSEPCFQGLERLDGVQLIDYPAEYWYPLASIFRNPYWRRLWVQQELILAPEIQVYCRRYVFDGSKLIVFQEKVLEVVTGPLRLNKDTMKLQKFLVQTHKTDLKRLVAGALPHKRTLLGNMQKHGRGEVVEWWMHLLVWFSRSGLFDMSEPRDRLYGILGLITREVADMKGIEIMYDAPVASVYAQVCRVYLEHTNRLCFLCIGEHKWEKDHTINPHGIPSWVPKAMLQYSWVNASNACGSMSGHNARINKTGQILCVEGHRLDRMSLFHSKSMEDIHISDWLQELNQFCQKLWPDDPQESLYEKDQVTSLFFPWLTPEKYKKTWGHDRPTYEQRIALLRALTDKAQSYTSTMRDTLFEREERSGVLSRYEDEVCRVWYMHIGKQVFVGTEGGRLGTLIKGQKAREGDELWIVFGCKMPLVLRPVASQERRFTLVGPAIFHGLMLGEAFEGGEI